MTATGRGLVVVASLCAAVCGLPWGGAVPEASAQTILVESAAPPTADQGTFSLPVTIKGSGFKKGAKAKFYVTGTSDPGGIIVSSTRFVSSTELTATIDVAATAAVAGFDVVVTNSDGRTGKGTDLFKVLEKVDECSVIPGPSPSASVSFAPIPGFMDANFGNGTGRVLGPRGFKAGEGRGIALQYIPGEPEPRFVLAGTLHDPCSVNVPDKWMVVRYLPDGSLDPSFGSGGIVTTSFAASASANDVVIDAANRIVVVGGAPPSKRGDLLPVVARYLANGSPDTSFGTGGKVFVPYETRWSGAAGSVALQTDGKIVMSASETTTDWSSSRVIRLLGDGSPDGTFASSGQYRLQTQGGGGGVTTQFVDTEQGTEERIVVSGYVDMKPVGYDHVGALWRLTSAGALDKSFGTSGVVSMKVNGDNTSFGSVVVDAANRLVLTGGVDPYPDAGPTQLVLARFTTSGALDPSFGAGGMAQLSTPTSSGGGGVAVQADGKVVVRGWIDTSPDASLTVVSTTLWRVTDAGVPDTSFGNDGQITHYFHPVESGFLRGLVLLPDGKIVGAGGLFTGDTVKVYERIPYRLLARFWP